MSERHIRRLLVIGLTVEVAAGIGAVYGGLWLLGWIGEHLPDWTVPVGFMAIPALALIGVIWDNRHSVELEEGEENV